MPSAHVRQPSEATSICTNRECESLLRCPFHVEQVFYSVPAEKGGRYGPGLVAGLTKRFVLTAAVVSEECSYLGSWDFAVGMSRPQGASSYDARQRMGFRGSPYSETDYRQTTRATTEEITEDPDAIVLRLVGSLRRALGDDGLPLPQPLGD